MHSLASVNVLLFLLFIVSFEISIFSTLSVWRYPTHGSSALVNCFFIWPFLALFLPVPCLPFSVAWTATWAFLRLSLWYGQFCPYCCVADHRCIAFAAFIGTTSNSLTTFSFPSHSSCTYSNGGMIALFNFLLWYTCQDARRLSSGDILLHWFPFFFGPFICIFHLRSSENSTPGYVNLIHPGQSVVSSFLLDVYLFYRTVVAYPDGKLLDIGWGSPLPSKVHRCVKLLLQSLGVADIPHQFIRK